MLLGRTLRPLSRTISVVTQSRAMSKVGLLSPNELSSLLSKRDSKTKVLDATWFMPNLEPPRSGWNEFKGKRIPGASFFDADVVATKDDRGLSHMLPTGVSIQALFVRV